MSDEKDGDFAFKLVDGLCKKLCSVLVEVARCFIKDEQSMGSDSIDL